MARSKDLDERNSTTPISAVPSTILGLDSIPEVDIEQDPEACNRSKRLTFLCKSLSIDDPKSVKITPEINCVIIIQICKSMLLLSFKNMLVL